MNKDDIHLLYEYDRWANNRVLQEASRSARNSSRAICAAAFVAC